MNENTATYSVIFINAAIITNSDNWSNFPVKKSSGKLKTRSLLSPLFVKMQLPSGDL